jgi:DNA-binding transcriptional MerR regulator
MNQAENASAERSGKGRDAFRTISEVAEQLDLPQHVLRFWESKFSQIKPLKRGGNRRYYRPDDVTLLTAIKKLLHSDGYTIRGVQKLFKAQGVKATILLALEESGEAAHVVADPPVTAEVEISTPSGQTVVRETNLQSVLLRLKTLRSKLD